MKAFELLDTEEKWCKGILCLPHGVHPSSKDAKQWCILGAVVKVYDRTPEGTLAETKLRGATMPLSISKFNDTHTFKEVRDLLIKLDI